MVTVSRVRTRCGRSPWEMTPVRVVSFKLVHSRVRNHANPWRVMKLVRCATPIVYTEKKIYVHEDDFENG